MTSTASPADTLRVPEHVQNLLYEPGYVFDPRSGPYGARYYPGPASGETEAEQR